LPSIAATTGADVIVPALFSSGAPNTPIGSIQHVSELPANDLRSCFLFAVGERGQCETPAFFNGQLSAVAAIALPQYARHRNAPALRQRNATTKNASSLVVVVAGL